MKKALIALLTVTCVGFSFSVDAQRIDTTEVMQAEKWAEEMAYNLGVDWATSGISYMQKTKNNKMIHSRGLEIRGITKYNSDLEHSMIVFMASWSPEAVFSDCASRMFTSLDKQPLLIAVEGFNTNYSVKGKWELITHNVSGWRIIEVDDRGSVVIVDRTGEPVTLKQAIDLNASFTLRVTHGIEVGNSPKKQIDFVFNRSSLNKTVSRVPSSYSSKEYSGLVDPVDLKRIWSRTIKYSTPKSTRPEDF